MMTSFPVALLILLLLSPTVSGVKGPRRGLRRVIQDRDIDPADIVADRHLEKEATARKKKGKDKNKGGKNGVSSTASQLSSAQENPGPLYVSPNGAAVYSITSNNAPGSTTQQETNGQILSAQGAPSETPPSSTNGGFGNNGASATVITQGAPSETPPSSSTTGGNGNNGNTAFVSVTATNSPPAPAPVPAAPAPTQGPTPEATVSQSTPSPTESVVVSTDNTTIPEESEATGNTTTPIPPADGNQTTTSGMIDSSIPALPFVDPNIPKPHVSAEACANKHSDPQMLASLVNGGFKPCTKTGNECDQAAGECCIEVFCMCGKPNGNIVANCVPDYDYYLLLETNK